MPSPVFLIPYQGALKSRKDRPKGPVLPQVVKSLGGTASLTNAPVGTSRSQMLNHDRAYLEHPPKKPYDGLGEPHQKPQIVCQGTDEETENASHHEPFSTCPHHSL